MKLIKTFLIALLSIGASQAATVTLTAGFGASGINVTAGGIATSYSVEVGGFEGGNFTLFPAPAVAKLSTDKIAGTFAFTGADSVALTGDQIFIRITTSVGVAILGTSVAEAFPDLTSGIASNSVTVGSSAAISVASFTGAQSVGFSNPNTLNFTAVPEPSTALLGLLGIAGLIRRRR